MKFSYLVLAAVLIAPWLAERAEAQGVDSTCLVLWQDSPLFIGPGYAWFNQDSVKVDICQGSQYLQEFTKKFSAYFQYYIILVPDSISLAGGDSAIHTWHDIDTSFLALRDSFQSIEQKIGNFTLQHIDFGPGDTSNAGNKGWAITFSTYLNIDTVDTALLNLPNINPVLGVRSGGPSFYESVTENASSSDIHVWPEPCNSEVNISGTAITPNIKFFDPLGRNITLPMSFNDNILTCDIASYPPGLIYCSVLGKVFKILIQH